MRTLARASASVRAAEGQLRLRALVLLPAVAVTAAAMHPPPAAALSGGLRLQVTLPGVEAVRYIVREDARVRPRRAGRNHAGVRWRGHGLARKAGRSRQRPATIWAARERPGRAQPHTLPTISPPASDTVPLEQRSLVAMHPLAPDPASTGSHRIFTGAPATGAAPSAPRCRGAHPNTFALAMASLERDSEASEPAMVEGEWPHCRGATHPQSSWRLASLGSALHSPGPRASTIEPDWPIHWRASVSCLAAPLRDAVALVAAEFGPLTVNSTCRSRAHNARVGGAPRSYHLSGNAVDFRVRSQFDEVLRFLARMRSVGGLTHYGSGVFHIDTGPRRTWGPNSWGRNRGRTGRRRA
jgi:hypothetical protein